jgi:hypothetical protein
MTRTRTEAITIQCWPGGQSFTYRGDPDGPENQRSLRDTGRNGEPPSRWRKGTADEWAAIRRNVRAQMYADRDVLCCDSSLVDDLLKLGGESYGCEVKDIQEGFSLDEIRNLYADPSDWDAEECREYASDHGLDLPDVPLTDCSICDGTGRYGSVETGDPITNTVCENCKGTGEVPEPDYAEDDAPRGWLTEARDACQEHAQENPAEVYEWWRVSSWLCDQLHAIGEVTIDNGYGHWWGRTCTGQGYLMDGTLQRVADRFERES